MHILNQYINIKNVTLSNRLVLPPMATEKSVVDGKVSQELCRYYDENSKGGYIGLIITEHSYISREGKASKGQLTDIDGLRALPQAIHL